MSVGMLRAGVVVLASSVSVSLLGLAKNVLAAGYFGTSADMDAYLLALLLPDMAMQLARTGTVNFIPIFLRERERSEAEAWQAASRVLGYWLAVLTLGLVAVFLLSPSLLGLLAPGLSTAGHGQVVNLTRLLLPMAAAVGFSRLLCVTLHADRRFLAPALGEAAFQLVSTGYLVAFHAWGIEALVLAQICGGFAQLAVVAAGLLHRRRQIRPSLDLGSGAVRRTIRLTLPLYLGDSGDKLNLAVSRAFASLMPAGAISALQYAQTLAEALPSMMGGALTTVLFPFLSREVARRDGGAARSTLGGVLVATALLFLPLTAGTWLLARPIVWLVFERGSFGAASTALTVSALQVFALGSFALAANSVLGAAFHARQDTLTPVKAGLVRVGCNLVLCVSLVPALGHRGVALAATLALYCKLAVLLASVRHMLPAPEIRHILLTVLRIVPAVGVMVAVLFPLMSYAKDRPLPVWVDAASLTVLTLLGALSYTAGLWLFCRRELRTHAALFQRAAFRRPSPGLDGVDSTLAPRQGAA